MGSDIIADMEDWKMYQWDTVKASSRVFIGPGFLVDALIASNGSGVADSVVHDGYSTEGKVIIPLQCKDDDLECLSINVPIYFQQGLYVEIGSNVGGVFLHWIADMAHIKGHPAHHTHREG